MPGMGRPVESGFELGFIAKKAQVITQNIPHTRQNGFTGSHRPKERIVPDDAADFANAVQGVIGANIQALDLGFDLYGNPGIELPERSAIQMSGDIFEKSRWDESLYDDETVCVVIPDLIRCEIHQNLPFLIPYGSLSTCPRRCSDNRICKRPIPRSPRNHPVRHKITFILENNWYILHKNSDTTCIFPENRQ